MVNLQNEVLKLIDESTLNENKQSLEEVSFNDITSSVANIKSDGLKAQLSAFDAKCESALKNIKEAIAIVNETEKAHKNNENQRDRDNNKMQMIASLKAASGKMGLVNEDMRQAKQIYSRMTKEYNRLNEAILTAKQYIDKKTSFFGRLFGFWK